MLQKSLTTTVKPRTGDLYKRTIRLYLKPAFGAIKLENLKPMEVQRLYTALQGREKPLTPKTIRNVHGVLHKALQQAVELGYIRSNPSAPCKLPKVEKAPIKPLDIPAIKAFLQAALGHRYEYIFLTTLFTGMREGEVLGLKWDCVDFQNGTILISRQLQRRVDGIQGYTLVSPKNSKPRKVAPAPFVMDILWQQQARQAEWKQAAGECWEETGLVFTDELGHNLTPRSVYGQFKKLIAEAGYPDTRFHDLRHSYAVAAIQSGDDIKTVQENLGHHTAAFTLDVYGHVTNQMKQASADRMQRFITGLKE